MVTGVNAEFYFSTLVLFQKGDYTKKNSDSTKAVRSARTVYKFRLLFTYDIIIEGFGFV